MKVDRQGVIRMISKLRILYEEGKTDGEIAKELDVSRSSARRMRIKEGLPAHTQGRPPGRGDSKPRKLNIEKGSWHARHPKPTGVSKFGIRDEDLPRLFPSAYKLNKKTGTFTLRNEKNIPLDLPQNIKKTFYGAKGDYKAI